MLNSYSLFTYIWFLFGEDCCIMQFKYFIICCDFVRPSSESCEWILYPRTNSDVLHGKLVLLSVSLLGDLTCMRVLFVNAEAR